MADFRSDPAYAWTPENGGWKDGRYYGVRPHYPAEPDATHATDNRMCSKCGAQRTFTDERGRWVRQTNAGLEEIEDQAATATLKPAQRVERRIHWYGFPDKPGEEGQCNVCSGRI
jgi:hypothetical protein